MEHSLREETWILYIEHLQIANLTKQKLAYVRREEGLNSKPSGYQSDTLTTASMLLERMERIFATFVFFSSSNRYFSNVFLKRFYFYSFF